MLARLLADQRTEAEALGLEDDARLQLRECRSRRGSTGSSASSGGLRDRDLGQASRDRQLVGRARHRGGRGRGRAGDRAARRAQMLSIGLLSGGYWEDELTRAGAFRVYRDPEEL